VILLAGLGDVNGLGLGERSSDADDEQNGRKNGAPLLQSKHGSPELILGRPSIVGHSRRFVNFRTAEAKLSAICATIRPASLDHVEPR